MRIRELIRKSIKPIYNRSSFVRYHITSMRMSIDNKSMQKQRLLFYSNFIKQGNLCFDIGANYGNRTDIFLKLGAKVVAVEPQEMCVEYLKQKYSDKIMIEQKGVGAEFGFKNLYVCDISVLSTFSEDFKQNGVWGTGDYKLKDLKEIEIITLDYLINKYGKPDFIKIDVEGFEPEVMKGLSEKVNILSFEYNAQDLEGNLTKCINILSQVSDKIVFNYSIGETMKLYFEDWLYKDSFMNIIKSKELRNSKFGDIYVKFL